METWWQQGKQGQQRKQPATFYGGTMKKTNKTPLSKVVKLKNTMETPLWGMGGKKYYNLMAGAVVPQCAGSGEHSWASVVRPACSRSGWCEDLCLTCGATVGYDTSD